MKRLLYAIAMLLSVTAVGAVLALIGMFVASLGQHAFEVSLIVFLLFVCWMVVGEFMDG